MIFESRQVVTPTTVGEELAFLREKAGFTVSALAEKAGVSMSIINTLESGSYEKIGPDIYTRQCLRRLAVIFVTDAEDWLRRLGQEREGVLVKDKIMPPLPQHLAVPVVTHWLSRAALGATVGVLVLYLGLGVGKMVAPPTLDVQLLDGQVIQEREIEVRGTADTDAHVTINGGEVSKGQDGYFYEKIGLAQGVNVIEVRAQSKYGKIASVTRRIVVK